MAERRVRLPQIDIRLEIHDLDVSIQRLRREQQFYRRMGFSTEVQDMQMVDYLARRRELELDLRHSRLREPGLVRQSPGILSWLVLAPTIANMAVHSVFGRRVQTIP